MNTFVKHENFKIIDMKLSHWILCLSLLMTACAPKPQQAEEVPMSGNPLFEGWYADPEGVVFEDQYWIYPTYSAKYDEQLFLDAFSSPDLVHWTKHEKVLSQENIPWLRRALWAPAIIHANNQYYLFFGGNDVHQGEVGGIGVAVADKPEGPFKDALGKPLINDIVNGAQPIDQFVFQDDDGSYYMYYGGWRHCNMVKLSADLLSLVPFDDGSMYKEITPENYVEGPFMLKRNGKYYFMWSEGGWTGPNYSVAYAIADSPFGPFQRIGKILQQDPEIATGAGHHSVIKVPGKDEYYIVYHRRPLTEKAGNSRVTCIDRLYFDEDGLIKPVKMTFEGVEASPIAKNEVYHFDKPLYGAAYYSEYTPTDRLDEDIRLMKEAGLTVVRVGESTWSLFEPQDGVFEFAWMDRILDKMQAAGIKVILGTPTYSIPSWMAAEHPEVLSHTIYDQQSYYGIRQNMDLKNPTYLRYCERIIRKMMEHFANHPAIIGYQVDNEVEARNIDNPDYFEGFREYIKESFNNNLDSLNRRWGLNYWGMNINKWEDFYDRKGVTNPSYKLWWERWNRKVTADFLNWQVDIVNEYKRPDQFVTHCFMNAFYNIDQVEAFRQMEYPAINVYYNMQDMQDGAVISYSSDYMRPVSKNGNFLVTETNAQGTGWSSRDQWPPYDGQLRQNMYGFLSSGANMVEYWHWATLHYGQETYWRGILGHEGLPNRVYAEFQKGAKELEQIGDQLVNLKKHPKVAMLFSHDSKHALDFMPYTREGNQYKDFMVYEALYRQNIECDILPCDKIQDFSGYDLLVIPSLYVATDELLQKISDFVKNGGEVVMLYKSGYTDQDNDARTAIAPGPLAEACGFTYQEFSSINTLPLKANEIGAKDNTVGTWMEFLQLTTAKPLAYVDHPFFGKWPCITENTFGKGHLIYIGTVPSREILEKLIARAANRKGIAQTEQRYAFPIILRNGVNALGRKVHYLFNYSYEAKRIAYPYADSSSLLDEQKLTRGATIEIEPWGVVIGVEK